MARLTADELPGSMVVLGLVIENPNDTVSSIGERLDHRFQRARFSRSIAHTALPRLAEARRVRCTYRAPRDERSQDRYEATRKGFAAFRAWMYDLASEESLGARPALREATYGRVELCRLGDLPRLIEIARKEQKVSADLYQMATMRLRVHFRERGDPVDYERKVREVLLYLDPMHWAARAERYKVMADRLEEIRREALPEARDG
jgi:hypothetical protein